MKQNIIDAAATIFSIKGYHLASVDEIAAKAGVAKGSIYYHFKGKGNLYVAVIQEGVNMLLECITKSVATSKSTKDALIKIMSTHVKTLNAYPEMGAVFLSGISAGLENDIFVEVEKIQKEYMANIVNILKEAQSYGEVRKGNPRFIAAALIGTLSGVCDEYLYNSDDITENEVIDLLTQIALSGITPTN